MSLWLILSLSLIDAIVLNIEDFGAVASPASNTSLLNRDALTAALGAAGEGDMVLVPQGRTYIMTGGVHCQKKVRVTLTVEGSLTAEPDRRAWPVDGNGNALHLITVNDARNFTVTGGGHIDGNGMTWWDGFILGELSGSRPRLFVFNDCQEILFERLTLRNSADQNINFNRCARVEVRFIDIITERFKQRELKTQKMFARVRAAGYDWALKRQDLREAIENIQHRGEYPGRTWKDWFLDQAVKLLPPFVLEPEDLNTDGIDPSGTNFHIHDCNILNDDDSIAIKPSSKADMPADCTRNILVENMVLTGFGASIGSVPPSADVNCVQNVTFRNISMPKTGKGIYIKSNPSCGKDHNQQGELVEKASVIDRIVYEDVTIAEPWWWAIWIGPQQQHEPGSKIGEDCALSYPHGSCPTQGCTTFSNIVLQNVHIVKPLLSPGVIMGNTTNPMRNVTFDNVKVDFDGLSGLYRGRWPFGRSYLCHDAEITSVDSDPSPCRQAETVFEV